MQITLNSLTKAYDMSDDSTLAVDNMCLKIKDGEFIALLGPSGCGKTTTLMMLAGLIQPTSGKILFDDKDVTLAIAQERNIGMVFQSYALYPHMSVMDNISFPLKHMGISKEERYKDAGEISKILRIDHLLNRKPYQLSGGQQQRVAMARALVKKPGILLLDEPMSNLDARLKLDVREEIREIQREFGITTVIVTHDQEEAMAVADRVVVMNKGVIQDFSSPEKLYKEPSNQFIAHFLGSPPMNFIKGFMTVKDSIELSLSGGLIEIDCDKVNEFENIDVSVGIRPHQIKIIGLNDTRKCFEGEVRLAEHMGKEWIIKVRLTESNEMIRILHNGVVPKVGDTVGLSIDKNGIHIFDDNESGKRIRIC